MSPKREPKWYKILNPIFTETNEPLELASGIEDTSFSFETLEEDERDVEDDYFVELNSDSDVGSENEESNSKQDNSSLKESTISKTVAPHKKRKAVLSQL